MFFRVRKVRVFYVILHLSKGSTIRFVSLKKNCFYSMLTEEECKLIAEQQRGTMVEAMQIRCLPTDDDAVWAEMPITDQVRQYFGCVHGGAYAALAETLAGVASLHLTGFDPDGRVCGTHLEAIHVALSPHEGKVIARATLLHAGRSTHVWNVDIEDECGTLLSTERVTNRILWNK